MWIDATIENVVKVKRHRHRVEAVAVRCSGSGPGGNCGGRGSSVGDGGGEAKSATDLIWRLRMEMQKGTVSMNCQYMTVAAQKSGFCDCKLMQPLSTIYVCACCESDNCVVRNERLSVCPFIVMM
jgi:hypothetical protein